MFIFLPIMRKFNKVPYTNKLQLKADTNSTINNSTTEFNNKRNIMAKNCP